MHRTCDKMANNSSVWSKDIPITASFQSNTGNNVASDFVDPFLSSRYSQNDGSGSMVHRGAGAEHDGIDYNTGPDVSFDDSLNVDQDGSLSEEPNEEDYGEETEADGEAEQTGRWTRAEHALFLEALKLYGKVSINLWLHSLVCI